MAIDDVIPRDFPVVTPEEEAAMEKAINDVLEIIHTKRRKQIRQLLGQVKQGKKLSEVISEIAYSLILQMIKKQEQDAEFWMNLAAVVIEEIQEIGVELGIKGAGGYQVAEEAMMRMVQLHGMRVGDDEEMQKQAQEQMGQIAQDPDMIEVAKYYANGAENPMTQGQKPMAQGVKAGLANGTR